MSRKNTNKKSTTIRKFINVPKSQAVRYQKVEDRHVLSLKKNKQRKYFETEFE